MKTDFEIVIAKGSTDNIVKKTYNEVWWQLTADCKVLNRERTYITDDSQRQIDIFGMKYLFFVRDGYLYYRIDNPYFDSYAKQIESQFPDKIKDGYQRIRLQKGWQLINLNTLRYRGDEYNLFVIVYY